MAATRTDRGDREAALRRIESEVRLWSGYVDVLLHALRARDDTPRAVAARLEELRNKRDSLVTKFDALKLHMVVGWAAAANEVELAQRELRAAWRTVIGMVDREALFA